MQGRLRALTLIMQTVFDVQHHPNSDHVRVQRMTTPSCSCNCILFTQCISCITAVVVGRIIQRDKHRRTLNNLDSACKVSISHLNPIVYPTSPYKKIRRGRAGFHPSGCPRPPQFGHGMWSVPGQMYSGTHTSTFLG